LNCNLFLLLPNPKVNFWSIDQRKAWKNGFLLENFVLLIKYSFLGDEDPTMEGHIGMACWDNPETDTAPTFYYFKDAMKGEKY
jgi:hypothetical protein